jgi:hypothetical protein
MVGYPNRRDDGGERRHRDGARRYRQESMQCAREVI